jgi:hypothetical protein
VKPRSRPWWQALEGKNPGEHPAFGALNTRRAPGPPGRVKTQEPRPVGPAQRFGAGYIGRRNGRWVRPEAKCPGYLPRGESSEG